MPEGPEVRRVVDKLRSRLKGKELLWKTILSDAKVGKRINFPKYLEEADQFFPSTCLEILCRGKQIFFFFENQMAFISGLGTTGHWYYFSLKHDQERLTTYETEKNYAKFALNFGRVHQGESIVCLSDTKLWYDDQLKRGNFTITNWEGAVEKMKTLGPDLLATSHPFQDIHPTIRSFLPPIFFQSATCESFTTAIRSTRRSQMPLCRFLMKQEYFAGIGNYLKSEILYRARLNPFLLLESLTDQQINTLFSMTIRTISNAYQSGGLTHGNFLDPDMEKGTFNVYIYKRAGQTDSHGYKIHFVSEKESPDGRGTYYVPELQSASAVTF
jgi:formamidopyrimidine-DNA glycosylase